MTRAGCSGLAPARARRSRPGRDRAAARAAPVLSAAAPTGLAALQRQPGTAEELWFCCWFVWFSPPPWERVLFCADGLSLVLDIEADPVRSEGGSEEWSDERSCCERRGLRCLLRGSTLLPRRETALSLGTYHSTGCTNPRSGWC